MSKYSIVMKDDTELYHYGVKGMKWGKRRGQTKKTQSANGKFARENRDTDYLKAPIDWVEWTFNPDGTTTTTTWGAAYESNTPNPKQETTSNYYKEHYKLDSGSKFVNTMTSIKRNAKIANLKVSKAAASIINSKAPLPIKLLAYGAYKVSNAVSNKMAKKTNTAILNNAMKKK